jgi:hypothetical protein
MATLYYTATSCGAASYISAKIGGLFEKGVLTVRYKAVRVAPLGNERRVLDRRTKSTSGKESSPQRGQTSRRLTPRATYLP